MTADTITDSNLWRRCPDEMIDGQVFFVYEYGLPPVVRLKKSGRLYSRVEADVSILASTPFLLAFRHKHSRDLEQGCTLQTA